MSDSLDLKLLLSQHKKMLDEFADFRDQLTVQTAICMRVESAITALTIEVRAMHSRHSRLARRDDLSGLEERLDAESRRITALGERIDGLEARRK